MSSNNNDTRVIEMRFDNKEFEANARQTINTLRDLKNSLDNNINGQAFADLDRAANSVDLSGIQAGIEAITDRFSTLGIVGMSVIQNITEGLMGSLGSALSKVTDSIIQGGYRRAQSIENARFQLQGLLDTEEEVNTVMDNASAAVDGTAFSLDAAANAASQFAASGIKGGEQMEQALMAISGVAATTNTSYEDMARVFTTVAGNGRLMGDQLLQLSVRGLNAAASLKDYFNGVKDGSIQASDSVKELINNLTGASNAVNASGEDQYTSTSKSLSKEYNLKKKTYDAEYKALQKLLNKEYNAKKSEYDKQYKALSDSLNAELTAVQKANSKRIDELNEAYQADVDAYRKATDEKIKLINDEYTESIKLIDEERYNRIKAIDEQIKGIQNQQKAEEKARELAAENEQRQILQQQVDSAKFAYTRKKAEEALAAFEKQVAEKRLKEKRQETIDNLNEEKSKINDEAALKKQEAAEKRSAAIETVQEESNAKLQAMAKAHQAEMEAIREQQQAQVDAMRESNAERLAALREQQTEELSILKEAQNAQLEAKRESQSEALNDLKEAQNNQLKLLKKSLKASGQSAGSFGQMTEITEQNIRDMVSKGLISFDLFSEAMSTTFGEHAKDANNTFQGAMSNIRSALARTGAMFYSPFLVQKNPVIEFLNAIRVKVNEINKVIAPFAETVTSFIISLAPEITKAVNTLSFGVEEVDGKLQATKETLEKVSKVSDIFIASFKSMRNILSAIGSYIKPVIKAFTDVFKIDLSALKDGIESFEKFTEKLKASKSESEALYGTFKNVFSGIKDIISGISKFVLELSKLIFGITDLNGVFNVTLGISSKLSQAMKLVGDFIGNFLSGIFTSFEKGGGGFSGVINVILDELLNFLKLMMDLIGVIIGKDLSNSENLLISFLSNVKNYFVSALHTINPLITIFTDALKFMGTTIASFIFTFGNALSSSKNLFEGFKNGILENINLIRSFGKEKMDSPDTTGANKFVTFIRGMTNLLTSLIGKFGEIISSFFKSIGFNATGAVSIIKKAASVIVGIIQKIVSSVSKTAKDTDFKEVMSLILRGSFMKAILNLSGVFKEFLKTGKSVNNVFKTLSSSINKLFTDLGKGLGVKPVLMELKNTLKAYTKEINAKAILEIAGAVGILALSLLILSKIDMKGIGAGLVGLTGIMLDILLVVKNITNGLNERDVIQMIGISTALIILGVSILELTAAVKSLSSLSWDDILKGLVGLTVLIGELILVTHTMNKDSKGMINAAISMYIISKAIKELAKTVKMLSKIDPDALIQGLLGIAGLLLELYLFMAVTDFSKIGIKSGLGIMMVAMAVKTLAKAVKMISDIKPEDLIKGLAGIAGILLEIGLFISLIKTSGDLIGTSIGIVVLAEAIKILIKDLERLSAIPIDRLIIGLGAMAILLFEIGVSINTLPKDSAAKASGIVVLAIAINILASAVLMFANMDLESLIVGLAGMAVALLEVGLAIQFIPDGGVKKAISLGAMAIALGLLADVLITLAVLGWEEIARSLTAMAGSLLVLIGIMSLLSIAPKASLGSVISLLAVVLILNELAPTLISFSYMDWNQIATSLTLMAGSLLILTGIIALLSLIPPNSLVSVVSMLGIVLALKLLVPVLAEFGNMNWDQITKSLTTMGVSLLILTGIIALLSLIPSNSIVGVLSLIGIGLALQLINPILIEISKMDWEEIAKGVVGLSVVLLALGGVSALLGTMASQAITGAGVVIILAASLIVLAGAINAAAILVTSAIRRLIEIFEEIMQLDTNKLKESMENFGIGLGYLGDGLAHFNLTAIPSAVAVYGLAESLKELLPTLKEYSQMDQEKLAESFEVLGNGIAKFGDSLKHFGITSPVGAVAMIEIGEAIKRMAPGMLILSNIKPKVFSGHLNILAKAFVNFGKSLKSFGLLSGIGADSILKISEGISKLAPALLILTNLNMENISYILSKLSESFKLFGESLDSFSIISGVGASSLVTVSEAVSKLAPALLLLNAIPAIDLTMMLISLGTAFKDFGTALQETPFWGSKSRAEGIGALIDNIDKLTNSLPSFMNLDTMGVRNSLVMIGWAFNEFAHALQETPFWGTKSRAEGIGALIDNIDKLTQSLPGFMSLDHMAVSIALSTIGSAFKDFGEALNSAPFWGVKDRGEAISILVDSIKSLSTGLDMFIKLNFIDVSIALATVTNAFKNFGEALGSTPFWNPVDRGNAIKILVDSIKSLSIGLMMFTSLDYFKVNIALATISKAFKDFGEAISAAPLWNSKDRAESIGHLVGEISILTDGVSKFINLDAFKVSLALSTIGDAFKKLGEAVKESPLFNSKGRAESLGIVVGHISNLVNPIKTLASLDSDSVKGVFDGFASLIDAITGALDESSIFSKDKIEPFTNMLTSLKDFSNNINIAKLMTTNIELMSFVDSLSKLIALDLSKNLDLETKINQTVASVFSIISSGVTSKKDLMEGLGRITLGYFITGLTSINDKLVRAGFTVAINFADAFSAGIKNIKIPTIDLSGFTDNASAIMYAAGKNSFLSYLSGLSYPNFIDIRLNTSLMMAAITAAIKSNDLLFEAGKSSFNSYILGFSLCTDIMSIKSKIAMTISAITSAIKSNDLLFEAGQRSLIQYLTGFSLIKDPSFINFNIQMVISAIVSSIKSNKSLYEAGSNSMYKFMTGFISNNGAILKGIRFVLNTFKTLFDIDKTFTLAGLKAVTDYVTAIVKNLKLVKKAIDTLLKVIETEINAVNLYNAGQDLVMGFIRGINDNRWRARDAGYWLGWEAYNSARKALDEHSPSKAMEDVGSNAGEGFVNGLVKWIKAASNTGEIVGESALDSIKSALSKVSEEIQNDDDFMPVITPVLDLSNVEANASRIGGLLDLNKTIQLSSSAGLSFAGGLNNLLNNIQASIPDNTNDDVVEAINGLRSDMTVMNERINNLQIVMDSGELVGAIINPIDEQLGFNATLVERGVR